MERVGGLLEPVRAAEAQGVIALIYEADDAPSWDFPEQKDALDAARIPMLLLDRQPYGLGQTEKLRQRVESFVDSIARGEQIVGSVDRQEAGCD